MKLEKEKCLTIGGQTEIHMEMAGALPWLITLLLVASIKSSMVSAMAKPGCRETCGNLAIQYPFGIGPGCYRKGFKVSCENNTVFKHNSSSGIKIYDINLPGGQARIDNLIATHCFNNTNERVSLKTGYLFTLSSKANMFTVLGCNTRAFMSFQGNKGQAGAWCYSKCDNKQSVDRSGECSGNGCCQTSMAPQLSSSNITFDDIYNNSKVQSFNPCSYAFVVEQDSFRFDPSYLEGYETFQNKVIDSLPIVLDWVAGKESCDEAKKNTSSYACISKNGDCLMSPNSTGYICICNPGFEGNPYLQDGCKDIDECRYPHQYPCHGTCRNTIGNYTCACASGTRSTDPKKEPCKPTDRAKLIKLSGAISIESSMASSGMAKPGCQETCGNLTTIPYPFGIGPGCFRKGFKVSCENNIVFKTNSSTNMKIYNIDLLGGQVRLSTYIASQCFNDSGGWASVSFARPFEISSKANKLIALGCNTLAFLGGYNDHKTRAGCFSMCTNNQSMDRSGECSGMGCCQTSIAPNLFLSNITFDDRFNNSEVDGFNPCSYAFIAEQNWFKFDPSYLEGYNNFTNKYSDGVRTVVDWVAGEESCDEAVKNASSYACIGENGHCITSPNVTGYICTCNDGFAGNPYVREGCQDIDECRYPDLYPCHGTCSNTNGNYTCACASGTSSTDPKREPCKQTISYRAKLAKVFGGVSACAIFLLICISALLIQCQRRKLMKEKEKFFQENGGLLLYDKIRSKQVDTVRIFTAKELENATDNFNVSTELGRGGHGTVYKGILKNNRVVAIKRSKIMSMLEKDEFVQEMIILSQINHRNVVKLLGCCLEVEVPMLVYECIPNGTLFELIHGRNTRHSISLDTRLRIAQESAEALAYLHSSASPPIVHGDVKSPNILLDDNYTAKVTDFGASRMLPKDEIQFITMVQGTLGYLDPEYLQERQLTEKSDVYSFGVVLLELITRKMAIYSDNDGEKKNLASSFLVLMKEDNVQFILDRSILSVKAELLQEVTQLVKHCLILKGEDRPLMTEVAQRLKIIRSTWREELIENAREQTEWLPENHSQYNPSSTGQHGSLMALDLETGR